MAIESSVNQGEGGGGLFMIICQLFAIISSGIICFFMNYLDCGLFDGKYFIFWQDYLRLFEIIWDYRVCALFEIIWDYRRLVYINCRLFALDYLRLFETRIISKYLFGLFDNFLKCRLFEIIYISNWAFQKMNKEDRIRLENYLRVLDFQYFNWNHYRNQH